MFDCMSGQLSIKTSIRPAFSVIDVLKSSVILSILDKRFYNTILQFSNGFYWNLRFTMEMDR